MAEGKDVLEGILELLDEAGLTWLTDEVRQLRFGRDEPSISSEDVAWSRRTYDPRGGESPFEQVATLSPERSEPWQHADYVEFIAARVEAMAGQLEQAQLDAAELGLGRVQFGQESETVGRSEDVVELLRSLTTSFRASARQ